MVTSVSEREDEVGRLEQVRRRDDHYLLNELGDLEVQRLSVSDLVLSGRGLVNWSLGQDGNTYSFTFLRTGCSRDRVVIK